METKLWTPLLDLERDFRAMVDRYWPTEPGDHPQFRLRTDMHREQDKLVVTVEIPGIDIEKDVEVTVEDDVLTIKGEKHDEREVKEEDHYMKERHYGSFERRIVLPDGVDPDAVIATYDKGVLTVTVPIPEVSEPAPKSIPVKAG
ncbi:MAG: Hsp20/alpha crystallin family protein [Acidimicrobiia bacterium]